MGQLSEQSSFGANSKQQHKQTKRRERERDRESRLNATALSLSLVAEKHIAAAKKEGKKEKISRNNIC